MPVATAVGRRAGPGFISGHTYNITTNCSVLRGIGKYVVADRDQPGVWYATNEKDSAVWKLDCNTGGSTPEMANQVATAGLAHA